MKRKRKRKGELRGIEIGGYGVGKDCVKRVSEGRQRYIGQLSEKRDFRAK